MKMSAGDSCAERSCGEEVKSVGTKKYPDYCRTITFTDNNGVVRELVFPKALDLDRPKRARTTFSREQLERLETEFTANQYLVGKDRSQLARRLGLSETQVKVWFQNRRTKHKRDRDKQTEQQDLQASTTTTTTTTNLLHLLPSSSHFRTTPPSTRAPVNDSSSSPPSFRLLCPQTSSFPNEARLLSGPALGEPSTLEVSPLRFLDAPHTMEPHPKASRGQEDLPNFLARTPLRVATSGVRTTQDDRCPRAGGTTPTGRAYPEYGLSPAPYPSICSMGSGSLPPSIQERFSAGYGYGYGVVSNGVGAVPESWVQPAQYCAGYQHTVPGVLGPGRSLCQGGPGFTAPWPVYPPHVSQGLHF